MMPKIADNRAPYEMLFSKDAHILRYMSLAKLVAMLSTHSIFLCRADLLEDLFEGTFTEGSIREHMEEWGAEYPEDLILMSRWVASRSYVNCWHASDVESMALWKIYAAIEGSLAIRSTVGLLQEAFPEVLDVADGVMVHQGVRRVQYIDYKTVHPPLNDLVGPLCYKRSAFAFEQEIRVVRQELPEGPSSTRPDGRAIQLGVPPADIGRQMNADLEKLIEAVYLAPASPSWLLPAVRALVTAFGFGKVDCRQSTLDELPEFGRIDF